MKLLPFFILGLALSLPVQGQVFTPSSGGQSKPSKAPAQSSSSNSSSSGSKGSSSNGSLFNGFNFDPSSNVVEFNGKTFHAKDNDLFRARFEKFLNSAETSDEDSRLYQQTLNEVLQILSPRSKHQNKISAAIARLEFASSFEEDGRLCDSIINAVYRLVLTKNNSAELRRINVQLDSERRRLDWNLRTVVSGSKVRTDAKGKPVGEADAASASEKARIGQRIIEKEKERVANLAKMNLSEVQSRIEFQGLMVQMFLQRRFEHVVISTRLYTEFYQDGRGKLDTKEGAEKTFAEALGYSPTVNTLDSLSNEMIRDVKQQVDSFQYLIDNKEVASASRQLQQAFAVGEFMPPVTNLKRDEKRKVLMFARNGFQLVNAIEVLDFTLAGDLVEKMRKEATDFDYSKPLARINTGKLASNMKMQAAKAALANGDQAKFDMLLQEAVEQWPLNPMIKETFNDIVDKGDRLAEARNDFDKLLSQKNYRQIYDNKERYIIACHDDSVRAADLKTVVENITEIEIALEQAKKLVTTGSKHAAWELLSDKFEKYPDDIPLSTQFVSMTPGVSKFAEALSKAKKHKDSNQNGSSLAWYLAAKQIFPHSTKAKQGINELVEVILPE